MSRCNIVASDARKPTIIGDLPNDILHRVLELMHISDGHLVFDCHFFQYVSNNGASVASIIHKILMQHTGNILGFHLISETHQLSQTDVDQCIFFVTKQGIQKLTLDLANSNGGKYRLPCRIFTCSTLTHLKLSKCIFKVPDGTQFPNLVCLELNRSEFDRCQRSEGPLVLPMLEILKLRCCIGVNHVNIFAPKIEELLLVSSYTITFQCFNVNPIFTSTKHLCLNGTSLEKLGSVGVPEKLYRPLNLQSLKISDLKLSVRSIACVFYLLRNSPKLYELDIDEVEKVDDTLSQTTQLLSYLSREENRVKEALRMIRTVRLRIVKGSTTEMYLIKVLLTHSPELERLIIQQYGKTNATIAVK